MLFDVSDDGVYAMAPDPSGCFTRYEVHGDTIVCKHFAPKREAPGYYRTYLDGAYVGDFQQPTFSAPAFLDRESAEFFIDQQNRERAMDSNQTYYEDLHDTTPARYLDIATSKMPPRDVDIAVAEALGWTVKEEKGSLWAFNPKSHCQEILPYWSENPHSALELLTIMQNEYLYSFGIFGTHSLSSVLNCYAVAFVLDIRPPAYGEHVKGFGESVPLAICAAVINTLAPEKGLYKSPFYWPLDNPTPT